MFFQLRSIDLPDKYEQSIQDTEVTKQGILRAEAERLKNNVTQQMYIEVAQIQQTIVKTNAEGNSGERLLLTQANTETFQQIQTN